MMGRSNRERAWRASYVLSEEDSLEALYRRPLPRSPPCDEVVSEVGVDESALRECERAAKLSLRKAEDLLVLLPRRAAQEATSRTALDVMA